MLLHIKESFKRCLASIKSHLEIKTKDLNVGQKKKRQRKNIFTQVSKDNDLLDFLKKTLEFILMLMFNSF